MQQAKNSSSAWSRAGCAAVLVLAGAASVAVAGPREQAKRIHDRLVGTPPTESVLSSMTAKVQAGDAVGAANEAMNNPLFYNTTLKNFVTPWTNEAQTPYAELNDFTATVIGMIRDNVPFNEVLSADILYVGSNTPAYSPTNNAHYSTLENQRLDMSNINSLSRVTQSSTTGIGADLTVGVLTTRAFGEAFLKAGTNRRAVRFMTMNFICRDIPDLHDSTLPPDRVRQDVSRTPGGDSVVYLNQCTGCHTGLDPMTQAFAYYDFPSDRVVATDGTVQPKNLINANNFPLGYVVKNDHWDNYWRKGSNAALGWDPTLPGSGDGIKSLGQEIAASEAFAQCQVQKVFKFTCLRDPNSATDEGEVKRVTGVFKQNGYSMKRVFAEVAAYCKGE